MKGHVQVCKDIERSSSVILMLGITGLGQVFVSTPDLISHRGLLQVSA